MAHSPANRCHRPQYGYEHVLPRQDHIKQETCHREGPEDISNVGYSLLADYWGDCVSGRVALYQHLSL